MKVLNELPEDIKNQVLSNYEALGYAMPSSFVSEESVEESDLEDGLTSFSQVPFEFSKIFLMLSLDKR